MALDAARSRFAGPSGDALECHFIALLGIATRKYASYDLRRAPRDHPILTATRPAEDLFSGSLSIHKRWESQQMFRGIFTASLNIFIPMPSIYARHSDQLLTGTEHNHG